ncbi:MAG TPA: serine hydrolase [Gammaproteobacteria bacterium]|nr:serine hydrolase [Gammaproteobacteria bacterium]
MKSEEQQAGFMQLPVAVAFVSACCLAFTIMPQPSYAATTAQTGKVPLKARLEQVARSHTTGNTAMGNAFMGTVLVAKGDEILLDKGYGMANVAWDIPNALDAKFRLGSLTKQFTAALVLLLQEDGKLRIEDPVSKYLPDAPKQWDKITLSELLHHTSGIPNFTSFKTFMKWRMTPHTHAEELVYFRDKPLEFKPGSKFEYSNSNYEVLGAVIEKVSGTSYGKLLQDRILKPLHMAGTGLDADGLILPKRAQGYRYRGSELVRARSESMTVPWAAGSMYSTTPDLLRWEHALFGGKLVSAASLKAMTTPGKGHYGLGVEVTQRAGVKIVSHSGGIEGFNTYLAYVPARKIAVVVLGNVNGTAPTVMGNQLLDVMLGKQVVLASERKPVPLVGQDLSKFEGAYALSPDFTLTFVPNGDRLGVQANGPPLLPLLYEGMKDGHPHFYWPKLNAQIEFISGANGTLSSIVMHANGNTQTGRRENPSANRKK